MNKLNVIIFITTLTSIVQVQLRYQCTYLQLTKFINFKFLLRL